jgi:catechol 2,3-dioxygenase-like lactoylglutathione lyase family enzyme
MAGFVIDHVQIAIPPGGEDLGRDFFAGVLGLEEIAKPSAKRGRGGCWFDLGGAQLHLGVDRDFHPARKAHVALQTGSLDPLRARLRDCGYEIVDHGPDEGRAGFFSHDPFGNRLEFVERPR